MYKDFAKIVGLAAMSVVTFVLLEILTQFMFPATFKAKFYGINSGEVQEIRSNLSSWHSSNPQHSVQINDYQSEGSLHQATIALRLDAIEFDFESISRLISAIEPSGFEGAISVSRVPSSMASKVALLLSALFFVVASCRTIVDRNPSKPGQNQDTHDFPA